jgi:uncharacterized Zn finger protein (UPF0148 family)
MAQITCEYCDSEYLVQFHDGKIMCTNCKRFLRLIDASMIPT